MWNIFNQRRELKTEVYAKLRPGDLLFFGEAPDEISHTGMYIGDGEFVHATAHGTPAVQISRIDEPYWDELLVGARRPK